MRTNDKNLNKLIDGEDINKLKKTDVRKIIFVQKYSSYDPLHRFGFFQIQKRAHPLPYYNQGLSNRLENT